MSKRRDKSIKRLKRQQMIEEGVLQKRNHQVHKSKRDYSRKTKHKNKEQDVDI